MPGLNDCPRCGRPRYVDGKLIHATLEPTLGGRPGSYMLMAGLDGPRSQIRARAHEDGWCAEVIPDEQGTAGGRLPALVREVIEAALPSEDIE